MKLNALIIDDSNMMRNMVMLSLRRTNLAEFQFIEAEDGEDGLEKFDSNDVDIIFVDWNMPNMSGIDFVRRIRRIGSASKIPIMMVTSENTMGKIEEALDYAGANGFISKPFTEEYLSQKLTPIIQELEEKQKPKKSGGGFFSKLVKG